jgi:hypothetical protein
MELEIGVEPFLQILVLEGEHAATRVPDHEGFLSPKQVVRDHQRA